MKRHDLTNVFILLTFRFVLSDYIYTFRNALKNPLLENINKITYKLWDGKQCSKMCCYVTCISYQYCKSFAFNSDSEWCQIFSKDFRNEPISGTALAGIVHYDLMNAECGSFGPFNNTPAVDCSEVQAKGYRCNGMYNIQVSNVTVLAWCDLQTDDGRWTVFQRRQDGSINFNADWNQYKSGFGNPATEYWIGNDALHSLTLSGPNELLVQLETWSGVWKYARYANFRVNDESDKYRITVSGYSGTAGDGLRYHNGQQFSTKDQDNDPYLYACNPQHHKGGWWYKDCAKADLNGIYYDSQMETPLSCHWIFATSMKRKALKTVFMMVRKA